LGNISVRDQCGAEHHKPLKYSINVYVLNHKTSFVKTGKAKQMFETPRRRQKPIC